MTLGQFIHTLSKFPEDKELKIGFYNPHSYHGYYDQLAFESTSNTTIGTVLPVILSTLGATYRKNFRIHQETPCWLAEIGEYGEPINKFMLAYILNVDLEELD